MYGQGGYVIFWFTQQQGGYGGGYGGQQGGYGQNYGGNPNYGKQGYYQNQPQYGYGQGRTGGGDGCL